ncbi:MAG: ABC transporter ATP-binding protein [Candidatus Heimdallarchaeaceae archaeon]|jgi:ABC-2 type transport system ATP-binding protein
MLAVETFQLSKDYETKDTFLRAVNRLNLAIEESEIYTLLGPNGAGKTTTVRLLTGLLIPSEGGANVLGLDIRKDAQEIRGNVGLLTETPAIYERLTVRQNLEFIAELYDVPKEEIKPRIENIIDLFDISEKIDQPAGALSKGMKQKVAIARAMIHNPPIIFLDEPTASLAPESAKTVRDQIQKLAKTEKRTFFLCTHNLFEAEILSSRIGIINTGGIIAEGTPAQLREMQKESPEKKSISLVLSDIEKQTPSIIESLVKQKFPMVEVRQEYPTLERIYLELVETESVPREVEEEEK